MPNRRFALKQRGFAFGPFEIYERYRHNHIAQLDTSVTSVTSFFEIP